MVANKLLNWLLTIKSSIILMYYDLGKVIVAVFNSNLQNNMI